MSGLKGVEPLLQFGYFTKVFLGDLPCFLVWNILECLFICLSLCVYLYVLDKMIASLSLEQVGL